MLALVQYGRPHTQTPEAARRPALVADLPGRGFRHHHDAAHPEERRRTLRREPRAPEGTGDDHLVAVPEALVATRDLSPIVDHLRSSAGAEPTNGALEEFGSSPAGIEQRHRRTRPAREQHQAGEASAGA